MQLPISNGCDPVCLAGAQVQPQRLEDLGDAFVECPRATLGNCLCYARSVRLQACLGRPGNCLVENGIQGLRPLEVRLA